MSAMSNGLRWFGMLLVDAAEVLEAPAPEPWRPDPGREVEEELRRMRERVQGRLLY